MGRAARAIIIEDGKLLVMRRNKQGKDYFTLVGGRANKDEPIEEALIREIKEETGLDITGYTLVFTEKHHEPHNDQYIFLCDIGPHAAVEIQAASEEALMNTQGINIHQPIWVDGKTFVRLPFITMPLQKAIIEALRKGFPREPKAL